MHARASPYEVRRALASLVCREANLFVSQKQVVHASLALNKAFSSLILEKKYIKNTLKL